MREYFNNSGFQRWKKIYGETDDVNRVQKDIRLGHSKTVENAITMLTDDGSLRGVTVCDAGCGTGSLSIPLAKEGAIVTATDISAAMVAEAQKQVSQSGYPYINSLFNCHNGFPISVFILDITINLRIMLKLLQFFAKRAYVVVTHRFVVCILLSLYI